MLSVVLPTWCVVRRTIASVPNEGHSVWEKIEWHSGMGTGTEGANIRLLLKIASFVGTATRFNTLIPEGSRELGSRRDSVVQLQKQMSQRYLPFENAVYHGQKQTERNYAPPRGPSFVGTATAPTSYLVSTKVELGRLILRSFASHRSTISCGRWKWF